jgi:hypothetical protein
MAVRLVIVTPVNGHDPDPDRLLVPRRDRVAPTRPRRRGARTTGAPRDDHFDMHSRGLGGARGTLRASLLREALGRSPLGCHGARCGGDLDDGLRRRGARELRETWAGRDGPEAVRSRGDRLCDRPHLSARIVRPLGRGDKLGLERRKGTARACLRSELARTGVGHGMQYRVRSCSALR